MKRLIPFILLLAFLSTSAQEYVVNTQRWDVKDGLNNRDVLRVFQDRKGFIWVYTAKGLSRFDGYEFKWYKQDKDDLPFIHKIITLENITEDSAGNIWVISLDKGAQVFEPESNKITFYKSKGEGIEPAKAGWVLDKITDSIKTITHMENCYFYVANKQLHAHQIIHLDSDWHFVFITEKGTCWIINKNGREMQEVTLSGKILRKCTFPSPITWYSWYIPHCNPIFQTKDGVYIVNQNFELKDITDKIDKRLNNDDHIQPTWIDHIVVQRNKLLSTEYGLIHDYGNEQYALHTDNYQYYSVKNEQLLMALQLGFYRITINKNKFRQFSYQPGSTPAFAQSYRGLLVIDSTLWGMNEFIGIMKFNLRSKENQGVNTRVPKEFNYFSVAKSSSGNLYFGHNNFIYELNTNGKIVDTFVSPNYFISWSILETEPGRLLFGTETGLMWLDTKTRAFSPFTQYNTYPGLGNLRIADMIYDHNRNLWLMTPNGLFEMGNDYGVIHRYSSMDTGKYYLPTKEVYHFYEDNGGVFWLATHNGLVKWDRLHNTTRLYTTEDGLVNDNIYSVYGDKYNRLWLSSDYGIMQFNKSNGSVISYNKDDGITNNEFNKKSHFQDPAGNIYFGSLDGITAFNPDDFPLPTENDNNGAPLAITSLVKFDGKQNKSMDLTADLVKTNKITMLPDDRYLNIEFSLLNYNNTKLTKYYWHLDGIDTGWVEQNERNIRLTRLPYGSRMLHVKARAANGIWGKNELQITINVVKPIYLRDWFLVLLISLVVASVYSGYKWRVRLLEKENIKLDKIVSEKTRDLSISLDQKEVLLKEIHHRVKNNLQIISSLLRLQSGALNDPETKNILMEGQNRVLAMALIHQKLYQNELNEVEMGKFSSDLFFQLKNVFDPLGKNIILVNEIAIMKLNIDIAVPFGLILNELITNTFKYAFDHHPSPYIKIQVEKNNNSYVLKYHDNGKGLAPNINFEEGKTMGLRLISRLSEQLNGSAKYYYEDGSNFIIRFET